MLKKTITYKDYDDVERTEDFFFNMNKAEVIKWLTTTGDYTLDKYLERLSKKRNGKEIMNTFENLLKIAYGEKSLDGRKFVKSDEIWEDFHSTEAFSIIFTELVTDAKKAAEFVNKIIPSDMAKEIGDIIRSNPNGIPAELKDYVVDTGSPVLMSAT